MKKHWIIAISIIIAVLGLLLLGGYWFLDRLFPYADPLAVPAKEEVLSISIAMKGGQTVGMDEADYEELLQNIRKTRPTRKMSVNESPSVKMYYYITVATSARTYYYYVYEEDGQIYVESPYEGVYRANKRILELVVNYCGL